MSAAADGPARERMVESLARVLTGMRAAERLSLANVSHLRSIARRVGVDMTEIERTADAIELASGIGGRA